MLAELESCVEMLHSLEEEETSQESNLCGLSIKKIKLLLLFFFLNPHTHLWEILNEEVADSQVVRDLLQGGKVHL